MLKTQLKRIAVLTGLLAYWFHLLFWQIPVTTTQIFQQASVL